MIATGFLRNAAAAIAAVGLLAACSADFSTAFFRGEPTRSAYRLLKANAQARATLGDPIKIGFASDGVRTDDEIRESIAVAGPRARGTLYLEGRKADGEWRFTTLKLQISGRPDVDLLAGAH